MDEKAQVLDPMPNFTSQAEEDEFWRTHDYREYAKHYGASFFKNVYLAGSIPAKDTYIEMPSINDPNLTENVNVRFDKRTVAELKELAKNDERTMASLIRRWVLEKMKEYKYKPHL
jgi:flagellar biosynthesis/type III secretory pathway M-ring protein FliF/YscJ